MTSLAEKIPQGAMKVIQDTVNGDIGQTFDYTIEFLEPEPVPTFTDVVSSNGIDGVRHVVRHNTSYDDILM